jgi:hypothetical protein
MGYIAGSGKIIMHDELRSTWEIVALDLCLSDLVKYTINILNILIICFKNTLWLVTKSYMTEWPVVKNGCKMLLQNTAKYCLCISLGHEESHNKSQNFRYPISMLRF